MKFGEWLAEEIKKQDMKWYWLARKTGFTHGTLRRYVRGKTSPSISMANEILNVLGMQLAIVRKEDGNAETDSKVQVSGMQEIHTGEGCRLTDRVRFF